MTLQLTPRWYPLRYHPVQARLWRSPARINVIPAGRRSGKSEIVKRIGIGKKAFRGLPSGDMQVIFAAPTEDQAVQIYWDSINRMIPKELLRGRPSEGRHRLRLINGTTIRVVGLDKPWRIEGDPVDWIAVDEIAKIKPRAWEENIYPALYTEGRPAGEACLLGVPRGRNHYYKIYENALKDRAELGEQSEYDVFHWVSADILAPDKIEKAKRAMDPLTFQQEYEASFLNFSGRAYYAFDRAIHAERPLPYRPGKPLTFAFDFNREPGVAAVSQEHLFGAGDRPANWAESICAWIGEVWIPHNSNTLRVAERLITDWGPNGRRHEHVGDVFLDGDATGGSGGSAKVMGSDWDLLLQRFRSVKGWNVISMVPDANPEERTRVNAMNSAWMSADNVVHMAVDPVHCPQIIEDSEGTTVIEGGSGEIDKDPKRHKERTHMTDGMGYHVVRAHPIVAHEVWTDQL